MKRGTNNLISSRCKSKSKSLKPFSIISIFLFSLFFIPFINAVEYEHIIVGGSTLDWSNSFLQKYPADFLNSSVINGSFYDNFLSGIVLDGNFIYYTTYHQTTIRNGTLYKAYANNLSVITSQVVPVINPENHIFGKLNYDNDYIYVPYSIGNELYGIAKYDKDLNFNSTSGFIYPSSPNNLKVDEEFLFFTYYNSSHTGEVIVKAYKNNYSEYAVYPVFAERIFTYDIDDNYLYAGVSNLSGSYGKVIKLYKENLTETGLSYYQPTSAFMLSLIADGDLIYYSNNYNYTPTSIYKENMTFLQEGFPYTATIRSIIADENYVYVGGTSSYARIYKYHKNLSFLDIDEYGTGFSIPYLNGYSNGRIYFLIGYSEVEQEPECEINADCDDGYKCVNNYCVLDYPQLNDVFVNKSWEGTENNTLIYYSEIYGSIVYGYNAFSTISEGVNAVNNLGYVWVRAGNYTEAIYINKDISLIGDSRDTTFILAPDIIPSRSYTSYRPMIAINTSEVLITGFTIDGLKKENIINSIVGVHFWKSSGELGWNKITGIRDEPFGSGNGIAILINHEWDTTYCHSVNIFQNIIEDYQKSGIVINEPCANAYVYNNIITGYGETEVIAQNGIQIGYGLGIASTTIIENNSISKHSYTGTGFVGTGILIVGVNNVTIKNNTIFDNENGIDLAQDLYYGSGSSLNIGILKNILTNNCKAIKIRPESNTSYIINNSISQEISETCFMIDNWNETIAQENYFGEEYPNWETIFSNYTMVTYSPYYSEPEMNYLLYECEIDEDCLSGYYCDEGICKEIEKSLSTKFMQFATPVLAVIIIFLIIQTLMVKLNRSKE